MTVTDPGWEDAGRLDAWVRLAWPIELRRLRAAVGDLVLPRPAPPRLAEMEQATRPLRWLLECCADGVTLTQAGYLPPQLVRDGAERFGWWPVPGQPRSEVDVHQCQVLRDLTRRRRLTWRRHRRLAATQAGRTTLGDPVELWRAVALGVGSLDDFIRTVAEIVALRLVAGPPAETAELEATAIPIVMAQDWRSDGRPIRASEIAWAVHVPLRYWRLFGLLEEPSLEAVVQGDVPWTISFTPTGRIAALEFLHSQRTAADAPRFDSGQPKLAVNVDQARGFGER